MREEPERGAINKFVATEREAWFVSVEDGRREPTLAEMLSSIFGDSSMTKSSSSGPTRCSKTGG